MSPRKAAALRHAGELSLRDHLIAAAERLIAERGVAGLTVRHIAREARVADGVLYNHFTDKEELLAHALRAHVRTVERTLPDLPRAGSGTVEANLRAYVLHGLTLHAAILPAFAGLLSQPDVFTRFNALTRPDGRPGLTRALADHLRAEQGLGRVARHVNADAAATMIVGSCHELVLPHMFHQSPAGPLQVPAGFVDDLVGTLLNGIRPPGHGHPDGDTPEEAR
ncbi:helix-turn-helix domain containing protein [Sphaerisporangium sp. TRM90804]|uniref:TetR/AcrR family transcriptional regulator n=1 Tax=Sphaerisporangium sp. TRM90804 TaxID=3031113 RepID=UPI002448A97A|nr:helix-turn-helix domain containing protein [Sphaerisporangium sp. TRM90804]MDH2425987.1 helix-turn-helix domain containing protein [Sphaerisporangium sp. TRM90804]